MRTKLSGIRQLIQRAARRMKAARVLAGVFWWLVACLGAWLGLFLLDNLLNLPAGVRLPLAAGGAALALIGFVRRVWLPVAQQWRLERAAVALEKRYGIGENLLINAMQFESVTLRPEENVFAQRAIAESQQAAGQLRLGDLWEWRRLWKWVAGAVVLGGLWAGYATWFPRYVSNAWWRFAKPFGDVPPVGSVTVQVTPAGEVTISEGDNVEVRAAVEGGKPADPPTIVWQERTATVDTVKSSGESAVMLRESGGTGQYRHLFNDVRRTFAFRVFAGDTYSRSVRVRVLPLPRLKDTVFRLTPPAYTGLKTETLPGPPAAVTGLAGSRLEVDVAVDQPMASVEWHETAGVTGFRATGDRWVASVMLATAGPYQVAGKDGGTGKTLTLAAGELALRPDHAPEVDFTTEDRNRFVAPGATVVLELAAKDDFGVREIVVTVRTAEAESAGREVKRWSYVGPPGNVGPLRERLTLELTPTEFVPGTTYLVEAAAWDFDPAGKPGKSRPVVLRVKAPGDLSVAAGDSLAAAFAALQQAVVAQQKANDLTGNLTTNLEEAKEKRSISQHRQGMARQQESARGLAEQSLNEFRKQADGKSYAARLGPVVEGEMPWVLRDIGRVEAALGENLPGVLGEIGNRQAYILRELIALLGRVAEQSKDRAVATAQPKPFESPPQTAKDAAKDLKEDLKKFLNAQERILERSKALLDKGPEDLTEEEKKVLGELAREEANWAKFFEEKLTDYSKLPLQDFADGSMAKEVNEVFQEVKLAAKELYEKKVELAVPQEQAGLENAKELMHNLERWLPDTPDNQKWSMEEPPAPADVAIAELPSELEDIVGELLDKQEEMGKDVEDVSSSWLDSMDKGAGWDAMDGPIANMSAKGVTGNRLPNEMEIGGRSGEGRTGRSQGQFVEETADGKGGRETPTRLSPTPFEQGSVKDAAKGDQGGATGGGKLSGFGQQGLRGPTAPPMAQAAPRLADRQAKIRQQAEALAMKLRAYRLPTGDLETAIASMRKVEETVRKMDGAQLKQHYNRVLDALGGAREAVKAETGLVREQVKLPGWMRDEITTGLQDGLPKGYEEMVAEYFRALAGKESRP
jgi:hypothetical protein